MHQLVLLTALSTTTGLFGGGHGGKAKPCGGPARGHCMAANASYCQPQARHGAPMSYYQPRAQHGVPMTYYPTHAPMAPTPQMVMAPQAAPQSYNSYYYSAAPSCAGGSCARR